MWLQLDGETNLKLRVAHKDVHPVLPDDTAVRQFTGIVTAEVCVCRCVRHQSPQLGHEPTLTMHPCSPQPPNEKFGAFTGKLDLCDGSVPKPLEAVNILLRGCVVRNVDSVYGFVVYTGDQTKVQRATRACVRGCLC